MTCRNIFNEELVLYYYEKICAFPVRVFFLRQNLQDAGYMNITVPVTPTSRHSYNNSVIIVAEYPTPPGSSYACGHYRAVTEIKTDNRNKGLTTAEYIIELRGDSSLPLDTIKYPNSYVRYHFKGCAQNDSMFRFIQDHFSPYTGEMCDYWSDAANGYDIISIK